MSEQQARIEAICRCCDEIEKIRQNFRDGKWVIAIDNTLGQCDWLDELHSLLYGNTTFCFGGADPDHCGRHEKNENCIDPYQTELEAQILFGKGVEKPVGILGTSFVTSAKSSIAAGNITLETLQRMSATFYTRREAESRLAESSQTERNGRQSKTLLQSAEHTDG